LPILNPNPQAKSARFPKNAPAGKSFQLPSEILEKNDGGVWMPVMLDTKFLEP
jgi:hypothetical protein